MAIEYHSSSTPTEDNQNNNARDDSVSRLKQKLLDKKKRREQEVKEKDVREDNHNERTGKDKDDRLDQRDEFGRKPRNRGIDEVNHEVHHEVPAVSHRGHKEHPVPHYEYERRYPGYEGHHAEYDNRGFPRGRRRDRSPPKLTLPECGAVYRGEITRMEPYGVFVQLIQKLDSNDNGAVYPVGLCHVSQLVPRTEPRIEHPSDKFRLGQQVFALVLDLSPGPKTSLSISAVDQETLRVRPDNSASTPTQFRGVGPPPPHRRGGGGPDWMAQRAAQRREMYKRDQLEGRLASLVWERSPSPASKPGLQDPLVKEPPPKRPRSDSTSQSSSSSSSSDSYSSDSYSSSESSYDRRHRRRRRKKRRSSSSKRRRRNGRSRSKRSSRRRSSRRRSPSTSSRSSTQSHTSSKSNTSCRSSSSHEDRDRTDSKSPSHSPPTKIDEPLEEDLAEAQEFKKAVQPLKLHDESDSDDSVGPQPLVASTGHGDTKASSNQKYGGALLPGEGAALAQFVQQNLRIPRRGEIGYSADQINSYERSGFVMSGSRHARMNAVRIRKENQVYSAEEQRALALITLEEKQQKEAKLLEDFKTMLKSKSGTAAASNDDELGEGIE